MLEMPECLRRVQVVENGQAGSWMDGDADAQADGAYQRRRGDDGYIQHQGVP